MGTKEKKSTERLMLAEVEHRLILFNDEVNSFDHVIDSLVEVCGHDEGRAEQCAIIAHYKGKCSVMSGDFTELTPMKDGLNHRGLSAEID